MSNEIDYELMLYDRIHVIKDTIEKYGEDNFCLSFSGGKDSTIVHHLLDMALPNNKIPRVFMNTGIEYFAILEFVKKLQSEDDRIQIINVGKNIKQTLERVGYPFKSKEHSAYLRMYQRGYRNSTHYIERYLNKEFGCPKILRYQFTDEFNLKVSDKCCEEFKKKPFNQYIKQSGRHIRITGMMKSEGGQRTRINCILLKGDKLVAFHPLAVVDNKFERWFIEKYQIELCKLYYPPFNFKRTGCKGCPFTPASNLQENLEVMQRLLPNERKQCEIIWKPVYEEYRRIGYRLRNDEQIKIF